MVKVLPETPAPNGPRSCRVNAGRVGEVSIR